MDKALRTVLIPIGAGAPLVDRVRSEFFSDSAILYTAGDSGEDLAAILVAAATLFGESLRTCVPLRGGIGHGRFQMDPDKRRFMGESLVEAYRIGEDAQWLGIVLGKAVTEACQQTSLSKYVVTWSIPHENGVAVPCSVLDWPNVFADSLKKPPIALAEFYQPFERLSGSYADLPPKVKGKYENTVAFMNARLSR